VFIVWLALDFKHIFQFVARMTDPAAVKQTSSVILAGQWLPGVTNGTFDALGYAFCGTSILFVVSNLIIRRQLKHQAVWLFWIAFLVFTCISALANGGTLFWGATGAFLVPTWAIGPVAFGIGAVITGGLLLFATMDGLDTRERVMKARATKERNRVKKLEEERRMKHTPKQYRVIGGSNARPSARRQDSAAA
jgi:hypothetical protein